MIRKHSKFIGTVALALGMAAGSLVAAAPARAADGILASDQQVAVVRVTLRESDGSTVRAPVRAIPFGEVASFEVRTDAHLHQVQVRPLRGGKVEVNYTRDGAVVASNQQVAVGSRRSSVVHRDQEGAQLSVSVTSTIVRVETK